MEALITLAVSWLMCVGLAVYIASQKGRSPVEALALGLLFGPLGCIVAALLPTIIEPEFEEIEPVAPSAGWQPPPPDRRTPKADDLDELAAFDAIARDKPRKPKR